MITSQCTWSMYIAQNAGNIKQLITTKIILTVMLVSVRSKEEVSE